MYNNTIYRSDSAPNSAYGVTVDSTASDTIIRNNYFGYPYSATLVNDSSGTAVTSNNVLTDTPHLTDPDNVTPLSRDFSLAALATEAINQGYAVPVLDDFAGTARSSHDIGAYEYVRQSWPNGATPCLSN